MRTKWFKAAKADPARIGLYEWECTVGTPSTLRWTGKRWLNGQMEWGTCPDCKWRGLTAPAK
jgi:hypothetical protein